MQFEHYLITRYNLNFRNWKRDKNGKEIRTRYWLKQRDLLFNTYCLPSVLNQTAKNFKWLVLTDAYGPKFDFPDPVIELRMEAHNWIATLQKWIRRNTRTEYVITTRLDNDDAIHKSLLHNVQQKFEEQSFQFINPYSGFLLYGHKCYKVQHPSNQFISLIESTSAAETVYCVTHGDARKTGNILQLADRRYWIRVVHNRNIIRDNLGVSVYCGKIKPNGFGIWDT